MIEQALFELLTGDGPLAALVGTRVYPLVLPQNPTLPALVYTELRSSALVAADGDTGMRESRFQVSAWGATYPAVKGIKARLVGLLSGASGGEIERMAVDAMHDEYEVETGWYRQIVEVVIHWIEA